MGVVLSEQLKRAHSDMSDLLRDISRAEPTMLVTMDWLDELRNKHIASGKLLKREIYTLDVRSSIAIDNLTHKTMVHGFWHNGQFYSTNRRSKHYYEKKGMSLDRAGVLMGIIGTGMYWPSGREWYVTPAKDKGATDA